MPAENTQIRTEVGCRASLGVGSPPAGWPCAAGYGHAHERLTCLTDRLLDVSKATLGHPHQVLLAEPGQTGRFNHPPLLIQSFGHQGCAAAAAARNAVYRSPPSRHR